MNGSGAELGMGRIVNASISGAFLETAIKLPVNALITLEAVSSAGVALEGMKLAARVARVDASGLGLQWQKLASQELLALLTGNCGGAAV